MPRKRYSVEQIVHLREADVLLAQDHWSAAE